MVHAVNLKVKDLIHRRHRKMTTALNTESYPTKAM